MSGRGVRAASLALAAWALLAALAPETALAQRRRGRRRGGGGDRVTTPAPSEDVAEPTPSGGGGGGGGGAAQGGGEEEPAQRVEPAGDGGAGDGGAGGGGDASGSDVEPAAAQDRAPTAIDVQFGLRLFSRHLSYTDDIFQRMRAYSLPAAPALALSAELYPGAAFTAGPLAHLGLTAGFERAFSLASRRSDGTMYETTASAYSFGGRVRLPFGAHEAALLGAWGVQTFSVGGGEGNAMAGDPDVPSVEYNFLRLGAALRLGLGERVGLFASASYLAVFSAGEMTREPYFHRASVGGVEAGVGLGVRLAGPLEARLNADMRRFFYDLAPEPGDMYVAGGALDEYYTLTLGLAYRR